jgi:hypothetical protein
VCACVLYTSVCPRPAPLLHRYNLPPRRRIATTNPHGTGPPGAGPACLRVAAGRREALRVDQARRLDRPVVRLVRRRRVRALAHVPARTRRRRGVRGGAAVYAVYAAATRCTRRRRRPMLRRACVLGAMQRSRWRARPSGSPPLARLPAHGVSRFSRTPAAPGDPLRGGRVAARSCCSALVSQRSRARALSCCNPLALQCSRVALLVRCNMRRVAARLRRTARRCLRRARACRPAGTARTAARARATADSSTCGQAGGRTLPAIIRTLSAVNPNSYCGYPYL